MKFNGIKRTWISPFYVNCKKHFCPECNSLLSTTKVSKIVNSKSPEAKDFDFSFSGGDGSMLGDVKFIWTEFLCPNCGKQISINEMKKLEKKIRKSGVRFQKLKNKDETVQLLEEILKEIDHESERARNGTYSAWGLSPLETVVRPEMEELLVYAKQGFRFYKYGKKHNRLVSVYFMTDSMENLSATPLGQKISELFLSMRS